jgi:hypothetical protein
MEGDGLLDAIDVPGETKDLMEGDIEGEPVADESGEDDDRLRAESLAIVRGLILKAHADVVPELVQGESLTALMDSVEPARAAYQRLVEAVKASAPVVPAGGASGPAIAIEHLSADGMIKRALAQARK